MRPVCHTHGICAAPDAGDFDQRAFDLGSGSFQFLQTFFGNQDCGRRAVRHDADIQPGQRPGDHRCIAHIFNRIAVALLGIGVVIGVDVILDADMWCHLLYGGAEFFHMAGDHHGVVPGIKTADGVIEGYVGG